MSDISKIITARQLAEMLAPYGDLPVKLRTEEDGEFCCVTLIERDGVSLCQRSGQDTEFGDIDLCRLDIRVADNA